MADAESGFFDPQSETVRMAAVLEGFLAVRAAIAEADMPDLARVHALAAREMVETGKVMDIADLMTSSSLTALAGPQDNTQLIARWQSYGLTMLAVEQIANERDPYAQPPLSEGFRAAALEAHGDNLAKYTPTFNVITIVE